MKEQQDKLRYPIGQFEYGKSYSVDDTRKHIKTLSKFPKELKSAIKKLKSGELEKTYRPEGWTVRQVINHLADSHMNGYIRFKLAVTENTPIIKPYEEQIWAELEDGRHGSIKTSVKLISALHKRWSQFLKSLQEDDLEKGYYHPASKRTVLIQEAIALYAWHSRHHLAHIMLVVDGKSKSTIGKKAEETSKTDVSDTKPKSAASAQAPSKRTISDEHREKIRAAQVARHAQKAGSAKETAETPVTPAAKRGRKPGAKAAAAKETSATSATPAKRGRKPGAKAAAAKETTATNATPAKRGRKPGAKAVAVAADAPAKRKRRTKAEMAAALTIPVGTVPTASIVVRKRRNADAAPVKAPKAAKAPKAPATNADGTPKKRGLSPERMAEIRALRGAKKATETTADAKPAKAAKAAKPAKAPATNTDGTPKKRGLSPERMAEIRALRGAKQATETATAVKPAKAPKAAKPAKAPATNADGTPKKRGLSPEKMAEIRALRGAKKTADVTATPKAVKVAKVAKAPAVNADGTPKKRGLSPEKMAEIRAMKKKK